MKNPKSAANGQTSPVCGAHILDEIAAYIRRYLVCDDHQLTILTLWSACTHCYNYFGTAPYLHVHSPQPHCGKSVCLELLADLSDADIVFSGIPAAALLDHLLQDRSFEEKEIDSLRRCPVLIDDYQHSFGPSERQPLVCLLASGSHAGAFFAGARPDTLSLAPRRLRATLLCPGRWPRAAFPSNFAAPNPRKSLSAMGRTTVQSPSKP